MSVKFRKFLQRRHEDARLENRLSDWAFVKDCWRPVKSYRTVIKGKKKGWIRVELFDPPGRKCVVPKRRVHYKEKSSV